MKNSCKLLSGMSHEMRSYMNSIVGFSFLINETFSDTEGKNGYSNQILHSCKQLIWLFESFLDSLMIDNGNYQMNLRRCKVSGILDTLLLEFREGLKKENMNGTVLITENQSSDISEVLIDTAKLDRIIRSLYQNAIRNTILGHVRIGNHYTNGNITFHVLYSGQDYYKCKEFLYTDDMDKSMAKFYDAGTAINITLARKLVQALGGTIWIEPYDLTGTGIYFSVPVKVIESSNTTVNKKPDSASSRLYGQFQPLGIQRVLAINNDKLLIHEKE